MELILLTCFVYGLLISGIVMWINGFSLPENALNDQRRSRLKVGSFVLLLSAIFGMFVLMALGVVFGLMGLFIGVATLFTFIEAEFRTSGVRNRAAQAELMWVLAIAVRSGRPLADEIEAYSRDLPSKRNHLLKDLAIRLRHGDALTDIVEIQGLLPQSAVMQIYSGISANALQATLSKSAVRLTQELADDQEAGPHGIALIYPAAVMNIIFMVCGFVMYYIIPKFKKIFDDFGTELPSLTISLIRISDTIVNYWYLLLLPFFYGPVAVFVLVMYADYYGWRNLLRYLFGNFWIRLYSSDVLRLFAEGIAQGRPIDEMLSKLIQHPLPQNLRRSLSSVLDATKRGTPFWQSLQRARLLSPEESALLESAERTGNLPWALETLAATIENRRYFRLRAFLEVLQPFVLICVALTVGFVVIALFMPLIKLLNDLS